MPTISRRKCQESYYTGTESGATSAFMAISPKICRFLTDFWPKICICQKKVVSLRPELCVCMYEARVHTWETKNKNSRLLIGTTNKAKRQQRDQTKPNSNKEAKQSQTATKRPNKAKQQQKGQTKPAGMACRRNRQNRTQLTGLITKHEQNN